MYQKYFVYYENVEYNTIFLYRDDDILYVSNGENFIHTNKFSHNQASKISEWITLNVGGKYFTTTRDTLTKKESTSMLARYIIFKFLFE